MDAIGCLKADLPPSAACTYQWSPMGAFANMEKRIAQNCLGSFQGPAEQIRERSASASRLGQHRHEARSDRTETDRGVAGFATAMSLDRLLQARASKIASKGSTTPTVGA